MNAYDVLDFLKSNADKRFKSYVIAKKFNVSTQTMTMTLTALGSQIENEVAGKTREFWFMSAEAKAHREERRMQLQNQVKVKRGEYKLPQSTIDALARAREGRSPDFGYVTIS